MLLKVSLSCRPGGRFSIGQMVLMKDQLLDSSSVSSKLEELEELEELELELLEDEDLFFLECRDFFFLLLFFRFLELGKLLETEFSC